MARYAVLLPLKDHLRGLRAADEPDQEGDGSGRVRSNNFRQFLVHNLIYPICFF